MNNNFTEDGGDPAVEGEEDAEEKRKQFKKQRSKQSREFEVEGDIAKPEFMATKSMVDYAPAEISAVEQYEALLAEQAERKSIRRRQLEVDRVELKRKITESVLEFDAKLLELYKTRLAIEKCILAEELKILLYDRRMAYQDQLDRDEERHIKDIEEKEEEKKIADVDLAQGRAMLDEMKSKRDQMFEHDKSFEKNFKKEFPGMGFNQLEALMKCFKKRPKGVTGGVERHLELMSRKGDTRQDSVNSVVQRRTDGAKTDLKAKSIAAALERVRFLKLMMMASITDPESGCTTIFTLFENYSKCSIRILAFSTNVCPFKTYPSGNTV